MCVFLHVIKRPETQLHEVSFTSISSLEDHFFHQSCFVLCCFFCVTFFVCHLSNIVPCHYIICCLLFCPITCFFLAFFSVLHCPSPSCNLLFSFTILPYSIVFYLLVICCCLTTSCHSSIVLYYQVIL